MIVLDSWLYKSHDPYRNYISKNIFISLYPTREMYFNTKNCHPQSIKETNSYCEVFTLVILNAAVPNITPCLTFAKLQLIE